MAGIRVPAEPSLRTVNCQAWAPTLRVERGTRPLGDPMSIRVRGETRAFAPNDWAPVHQGIAGPVIFAMRGMSGTHQLYVEI